MLVILPQVVAAFKVEGLAGLRAQIIESWHVKLRKSSDAAGDTGRFEVLDIIEAMASEDPSLTIADLQMLADLMLVERANSTRAQ